jgi:hypothetical protein
LPPLREKYSQPLNKHVPMTQATINFFVFTTMLLYRGYVLSSAKVEIYIYSLL